MLVAFSWIWSHIGLHTKTVSKFDSNRSECMYAPYVSKFSFFVWDSRYLKMCQFSDTCSYISNDTHKLRRKNIIQSTLVDCQCWISVKMNYRIIFPPSLRKKKNVLANRSISASSHFLRVVPRVTLLSSPFGSKNLDITLNLHPMDLFVSLQNSLAPCPCLSSCRWNLRKRYRA